MRVQDKKLLELLGQSGASLHRLLTKLTLREEIAEELMQELFLKLGNSDHVEKIADLDAYAHRAAVNLAFDWRRGHRQNTVNLDQVAEPASREMSPLDSTIRTEELEEILNVIGQLEGASREAFVMRHIQQQPYDAIARVLGQTEHQVRALCHKGLERIRQLLEARKDQVGRQGAD